MLQAWMGKVREHMETSPIRRAIDSLPGTPRSAGLAKVDEQVKGRFESLDRPLSVVVMGEVKAGKSTLINAFAGTEVAPSDVLETTSTIMEIQHGTHSSATVRYHSGQLKEVGIKELFDDLEAHRGEEEFFSQIKLIKANLPLPSLKRLRLVDTPGLATVNDANASVTMDYVRQADVVLWVLNGLHLGQADVVDKLADIAKLGTPILAVVNRVDQVQGNPESLTQYAERQLAAYVEQVFPLSALQAYQAVTTSNKELEESSGFTYLRSFLEENVDRKADDVKVNSVLSAMNSALRMDTAIHDSYSKQIGQLIRLAQENKDEMARRGRDIADLVKQELVELVHRELFAKQFTGIMAQKKVTKEIVERAFSHSVLEQWWQQTSDIIDRRLKEEWKASHADYVEKLKSELSALAKEDQAAMAAAMEEEPEGIWNETLSSITKGAVTGGATGLGLAAYAAWLGPYAATVGIVPAAMAFVPPVAVAGIVAGVIFGAYNRLTKGKEQQQNMTIALRNYVKERRQEFIDNFVRPKVFPAIDKSCQQQAVALHQRFISEACSGWELDKMAELASSIEGYAANAGMILAEQHDLEVTA